MDLDDVGVVQPGHGLGLPTEPLNEGRILGPIRGEDLDGDVSIQRRVVGPIDARHPTDADALEYLIPLLTSANMIDLLKPDLETPDSEVTPEFVARNLCIIGSVDDCIEQLEGLWDLTGGFGKLLMMAHDWDDKVKWQNSMKRLAQEIVPKLPSL